MHNLFGMLWIEYRKALRSHMLLWTNLVSLFFPFGIALLIFIAMHPQVSQKLGLMSAKANLIAYSATDWPAYVSLVGQIIAASEFFLLVFAISWVFGREFADGTVKDLLAVPVPRSSILLAKFILIAGWSVLLTLTISLASLAAGALLKLPGFSPALLIPGGVLIWVTACLAALVSLPFAYFASKGRGYLLPIGTAVISMLFTNLVIVLGWGEYFPWAVPMLYAQAQGANLASANLPNDLPAISYWIVGLTGLAGMAATYLWWMRADQNR
jgi:ABC-2 type transport system permease protein